MSEFNRTYPKGRISGEDEGATQIAIAADHRNSRVILRFFKPMDWIAWDIDSGLTILKGIAEKLSEISDVTVEVVVKPKDPPG